MKTRTLIIIGIIIAATVSAISLVTWMEYGVVCSKPVLDHLHKYSNLFDDDFDGTFTILDIGFPFGVTQWNLEECADLILEKRTSMELENEN